MANKKGQITGLTMTRLAEILIAIIAIYIIASFVLNRFVGTKTDTNIAKSIGETITGPSAG